jgi:transcriptional regulator with XRE-family HTH domain
MAKHRMALTDRRAIGQRLKVAREAARLTQAEAAKKLGLRVTTTLSNYEQGRTEIPLRLLADVCELYGHDINALVLGAPQGKVVNLNYHSINTLIRKAGLELVRELEGLVHELHELLTENSGVSNKRRKRARA